MPRYTHSFGTITAKLLSTPTSHHRIISNIAVLPLVRPALLRPRKVDHRNHKERIAIIQQPSQHVIPSNKGRNDTKRPTCSGQGDIGVSVGRISRIEVAGAETDERNPDRQEQRVERESRSQREQPHHEREDEPSEDLVGQENQLQPTRVDFEKPRTLT